MLNSIKPKFFGFLLLIVLCISQLKSIADDAILVPLGGNAWVKNNGVVKSDRAFISDNGIENWKSGKSIISTFIYVGRPGSINISLRLKVANGKSKIKLEAVGSSMVLEANNNFIRYVQSRDNRL